MNNTIPLASPWSTTEKIAFRFFFVFFLLFIIVENNGAFPFFDWFMTYPTEWLHAFIVWAGENILKLPYKITYFTYGSGDTTYDYVLVLFAFITALVSCVIWTLLDRNSTGYPLLYYWLTVIVRFYVGLMLINYGLIKIFKLQFPYPYLNRLLQPYGDSSPMGLAWTFLGFSQGYNYFMGVAEVAAGLLLFRRTLTFGAIVTLMATANVMAVNYFYDVPVKILSTALFVFSFFLLSRDLKRLAIFFFSGKSINLPVIPDPYAGVKPIMAAKLIVKSILLLYVLGFGSYESYQALSMRGDSAPKPTLYGVYDVAAFVMGKDTIAPLAIDNIRWKRLSIGSNTSARIFHMKDSISRCFLNVDTVKKTMELKWATDTTRKYLFEYNKVDSLQFSLRGTLASDSLFISLIRVKSSAKDFRLTGRGFHWINETPYNR